MEEEKKKIFFLFVFSTYLPVFILKFQLGELVGCGIKLFIQRVPTWHTFDGPFYPKNKKYLRNMKMMSSSHFLGIRVFGVDGSIKIMQCGYSLDVELNSTSNEFSHMSKIRTKKVVFFFSSSKINKYYFIILTIILLNFLGGPF